MKLVHRRLAVRTKFFITNSYFGTCFEPGQWWDQGSSNASIRSTRCGLKTTRSSEEVLHSSNKTNSPTLDISTINTIINNKNIGSYLCITEGIWSRTIFHQPELVGEDTNVTNSGSDPRREFQSTIDIDSVNANEGWLYSKKYYSGDSSHYSPLLALSKLWVFVSNNVNYYDPLLISGITIPLQGHSTALHTALIPGWYYPGAYRVNNIPCEWMNPRAQALFRANAPPHGGFSRNAPQQAIPNGYTGNRGCISRDTNGAMESTPVRRSPFSRCAGYCSQQVHPGRLRSHNYSGRDSAGNKTENGSGISKFTDLTENFSQSTVTFDQ